MQKKLLLMLLAVAMLADVLFTGAASAQNHNDERTTTTRIADLLAQVPARDSAQLERNMKEVADLGAQGYVTLISGLSSPGHGNHSLITYTVGSFTAYASKGGRERLKSMAQIAYCEALAKVSAIQNKAFIISQLELAGDDAAIYCLESYLTDEQLADEASRALVKIGSPAAVSALLKALPKASAKARLSVVEALGHTGSTTAATAIEPFAADSDKDLAKASLFALANIAAPTSIDVLLKAAGEAHYSYDQTNAVAALLVYAGKRLSSDRAGVEKMARTILTQARDEDQVQTRIAALRLIAGTQTDQQALLDAMADRQFEFRAAAIAFATDGLNEANAAKWIRLLGKADAPTQVLLVNMLSKVKSTYPAFLKLFKNKDAAVRSAAFFAAARTGGSAAIGSMVKAMGRDTADIAAVSGALLNIKGNDVPGKISPHIASARPAVQAALINVLAARAATDQFPVVSSFLSSDKPEVSKAAFSALKHISTAAQKDELFRLLNAGTDDVELKDVQAAIVAVYQEAGDAEAKTAEVMTQMDRSVEAKKILYYSILSSIGGKRSLDVVSSAFHSGDDVTKKAALAALSSWTDAGSADELMKIARTAGHTDLRDLALNGYLRVIRKTGYPAQQRLLLLRNAMAVARTPSQQKTILKDTEQAMCYDAIVFAGGYLDNPALQQTAANAVMNITMAGVYEGEDVKALLNKTIAVITGNDAGYQKEGMRKYISSMRAGNGADSRGASSPNPFKLSTQEKKEGFKILFDGSNLQSWTGNTTDYVIADGNIAIRPQPGKGSGGNLFTREEFSDFIFRFEFQLSPGANNGLGIRAPLEGDAAYTGIELQILDNDAPIYKDLHEYQYHGSVYGTIPAKRGFLKPVGEWNYQEVIARGSKIKVTLNGTVILDADLTPFRKNGTPDQKKHPGLNRDSGHIGFLGHGSPVQFRNIRIKDLSKNLFFQHK